uniref:Uncharacterized protein n=1 Tax=Haptolina brevifila TaxID=156173 RepID=A0A6U7LP70_9EUKA|mmetsp:Transcript_74507/g.148087  ORF Transcript_74507/g.148087 Transcript_74507/m.148087 type:complete len:150 (+) Transcript_74507:2-451(+)
MKLEAGGDGTRFYVFDNVPDAKAFKRHYRAGLDGLPVSEALASALVDEANAAFVLNMELFRHLDAMMGLASVPVAPNMGDASKCPFAASVRAASGGDAAPATPRKISNCPVHWSFYVGRPWILQSGAVVAALGAAFWAACAMSSMTDEL